MNSNAITRALRRAHSQPARLHHKSIQFAPPVTGLHRSLRFSPLSTPSICVAFPTSRAFSQIRSQSTATGERPLTDRQDGATDEKDTQADAIAARKAEEPAYEMTFTCRKCLTRSSHRVTKQAYHFGTTLITCPGCKNRHLISDHLRIFSDKGITIEDILREKGELLKKGRLGDDGAVEFYDDDAAEKVQQKPSPDKPARFPDPRDEVDKSDQT